jgi:hypothetical protein
MDAFAPIAGISLEQYAELCAEIADHPEDAARSAQVVAQRGVGRAEWEAARAGWTARLQDLSLGGAAAARFAPVYQAALSRRRGPPPQVAFEVYACMCGEAMAMGLVPMLRRHGLDRARWSQVAFHWNGIIAGEPARFAPFMAMVEQEAERLLAGGAPQATSGQKFEKQAEQAVHAVGSAMVSGFSALGSALDSFGKSLSSPKAGSRVLVTWSDGNRYPGTVVQVGQGQYLVAMSDGRQHWVPEASVKSA